MSFADLRKARQSKESQSFVAASPALAPEAPVPETLEANVNEGLQLSHGLYKALPASLSIRVSDTSGRGIWSRGPWSPDRTSLPQSATETHTHLAHSLVRYLGLTSPAELAEYGLGSAAALVDFISRVRLLESLAYPRLNMSLQFVTNTFTLTSPSLTPIGIAVSPMVALINHSCEPNAVVVFPRAGPLEREPRIEVIALRPIGENEEVCFFLFPCVDTLTTFGEGA
ncbi:hypothetical protein HWV62_42940 [Athelia sp. TMB]|nr:hypothetical protein HWV62_42940 [Athelia sp. TMB]